MIRVEAELQFTTKTLKKNGFKLMFVVGGVLLFAGTLQSPVEDYVYGEKYPVVIQLDVDMRVYRAIKSMLGRGESLGIHKAGKVIGVARIMNCTYL